MSDHDDTYGAPVVEVLRDRMASNRHTVVVRPYTYGQYRIQLTRIDRPDPFAPPGHGSIVRELCTYSPGMAADVVLKLRLAADPEGFCETLAHPGNCEYRGGRIRLDTAPEKTPDA